MPQVKLVNFRAAKEGLGLQDQWGKRVIRAEMDMMAFLEGQDSKESLDYLE